MVLSTRLSILYLFTRVGLGYGQFTGRIALPIRSFFLEVETLTPLCRDYQDPRDYGRAVRSLCSLATPTPARLTSWSRGVALLP